MYLSYPPPAGTPTPDMASPPSASGSAAKGLPVLIEYCAKKELVAAEIVMYTGRAEK